ncbi:hypothetical protein F4859DRAFT_460264 [Xylaria cf. heliscus]|nr:hypothetical protein F4859DRAFT_460264 [Xylaria cf. heliscus]
MKNLRMFKKLVGEDGLANVVLATTMWSTLPDIDAGRRREAELRGNFWRHMIDNGSEVFRQDRDVESAKVIVQHIISRQSFVALDIQRDMIDRNLPLDETAAGQEVQAELDKQRAKHERRIRAMREEMREAIAERDQEHQEEIRQQRADIEKQMRANEEAIHRLKASKEEIRLEMEAKWQQERQQLMEHYEDIEQSRERRYEQERAEQRARQERLEREQRNRERQYEREQTEQRERQERLEKSLREQREEQARQQRRTPTPGSGSDSSPSSPPRRSPSSSPLSITRISSPPVPTFFYSRPLAPPSFLPGPGPSVPMPPFIPPPLAFRFAPPQAQFTSFYAPCQCGVCTGYGTSPCPYC